MPMTERITKFSHSLLSRRPFGYAHLTADDVAQDFGGAAAVEEATALRRQHSTYKLQDVA